MPTNKNAAIRYQTLDKCFRDRRHRYYIEDLIERENTFTMEQFAASVDEFLHFRRYQILPDKGKVKKADAERYAKGEYDIFNRTQPIESDFDREVKKLVNSQEEE